MAPKTIRQMRRFASSLSGACVAALVVGPIGCHQDASRSTQRPDVILIVVDTLRRADLSVYGNKRSTSPSIDALAATATRYTRATSQAPWTTPSVASLLTSLYPSRLGIRDLSMLRDEAHLLPEVLKAAGYVTGGVVSHDFVSASWGFRQGFDSFDDSNALGHDAVTSRGVSDLALAFLDAHPREPLFLFLHFFDPHYSYIEHEGFEFPRDAPYTGIVRSGMTFRSIRHMQRTLGPADAVELLRIYDSEVAFTDAAIGRVLERLRDGGRLERALVIVTGDHGEAFLEHGALGHTRWLYQELVSVPLIVKFPYGERRVVDRPVALIDIFPTVLEVLGLPPDPSLAGRSLLDQDPGERAIFSETSRNADLRAVVKGRYKLIVDERTGRSQLFDVVEDPHEDHDLAATQPEEVAALRDEIRAWSGRNVSLGLSSPRVLSEEERRKLRALGYAE